MREEKAVCEDGVTQPQERRESNLESATPGAGEAGSLLPHITQGKQPRQQLDFSFPAS